MVARLLPSSRKLDATALSRAAAHVLLDCLCVESIERLVDEGESQIGVIEDEPSDQFEARSNRS